MLKQNVTAQQLAHRLKELRKQQGVSQDLLVETSGVARATLVNIERGRGNPRLSILQQLANALGVDVFDLFAIRPADERKPAHGLDECGLRIAKNVNRLRISLGLSQLSLSLESGHFRTYVGSLEHQLVNPTIGDLEPIAVALGVGLPSLLKPLSKADAKRAMQNLTRGGRKKTNREPD
jgi:transcriptional regulator with XRE-family HTH domain